MPIYSYVCPKCQENKDLVLPIDDRDLPHSCKCGAYLERKMAMPSFKFVQSGRTRVLDTLNYEANKPGLRSPRSTAALAHGLERIKPVIGKGFKAK